VTFIEYYRYIVIHNKEVMWSRNRRRTDNTIVKRKTDIYWMYQDNNMYSLEWLVQYNWLRCVYEKRRMRSTEFGRQWGKIARWIPIDYYTCYCLDTFNRCLFSSWLLCCLSFFDYGFTLPLWYLQTFLILIGVWYLPFGNDLIDS
jgi:hypothetical protein